MVLELHELIYQLVFKIPNADVRCHGGLKKGGTRAHQARVPEKVVFTYLFRK